MRSRVVIVTTRNCRAHRSHINKLHGVMLITSFILFQLTEATPAPPAPKSKYQSMSCEMTLDKDARRRLSRARKSSDKVRRSPCLAVAFFFVFVFAISRRARNELITAARSPLPQFGARACAWSSWQRVPAPRVARLASARGEGRPTPVQPNAHTPHSTSAVWVRCGRTFAMAVSV